MGDARLDRKRMLQDLLSAKLQQQHIRLQQVKALIVCLHDMNKAAEVYKRCVGTCRCGSRQILGWQQAAEQAGGHIRLQRERASQDVGGRPHA